MRRVVLILLMISAFASNLNAQENPWPRVTFGAEWSYIATVHTAWHYNFFSPEGYRVNYPDNAFLYRSNGEAYLHAGYNFDEHWNLSLYIGMAGISDHHNAVPMSIRGTRYFGADPLSDRWFAYIDLGSGISLKMPPQEIFAGKIGGGYRMSLSRNTKLDFVAALRMTYTHPMIIHEDIVIQHDRINRNDAFISAISVGIGITF